MQLKIKTPDIELEYTDEYSIIEEAAKKRILEIINQLYTHHQTNSKIDTVSPYNVLDAMKK
jgi:hypothetical protein